MEKITNSQNEIYTNDLKRNRNIFVIFFILFQIFNFVIMGILYYNVIKKDNIITNLNNKIINILKDTSFVDLSNDGASIGNDLNNNLNINQNQNE